MGKLSACLVLALAACGSSNSKKPPDAQIVVPDAPPDAKVFLDAPIDAPPVFDFACVNNPAPMTANATVAISGNAQEVGISGGTTPTFSPLANATVDACTGNCMGQGALGSAMTDASGNFNVTGIATGGTPLAAYLKLTPPAPTPPATMPDKTVLEYPAEPVTADVTGIPLFTLTPTAAADLAILGCTSTSTQGMLAVLLTDCSNMPITDTTHTQLIIKQGGTDITASLTVINLGQFSSMAAGTYLLCKVPANATTSVGATYTQTMTTTFLAHDVAVVADEITATQIRPGY
ncbi:MAG: hypothetical protein ACM31C_26135 [Acidobacteriota bacterium]